MTYVADELSACQLCSKLLRQEPQMFPCFHVFCVACLDGMNFTAGTRLSCPLCGTAVIVSSSGLGGTLPTAAQLVRKLVTLRETFGDKLAASWTCDVCNGDDNSCKSGGTFASKMSSRYVADSYRKIIGPSFLMNKQSWQSSDHVISAGDGQ